MFISIYIYEWYTFLSTCTGVLESTWPDEEPIEFKAGQNYEGNEEKKIL